MTVYFKDEFDGTGSLIGHVPDIGPPWSSVINGVPILSGGALTSSGANSGNTTVVVPQVLTGTAAKVTFVSARKTFVAFRLTGSAISVYSGGTVILQVAPWTTGVTVGGLPVGDVEVNLYTDESFFTRIVGADNYAFINATTRFELLIEPTQTTVTITEEGTVVKQWRVTRNITVEGLEVRALIGNSGAMEYLEIDNTQGQTIQFWEGFINTREQ